MLSLAEALAALPDTADGIAAHLTAKGIRGVTEDSCNCPMTNYLTGLGFDSTEVGERWVIARSFPGDRIEKVATPNHIREFIFRFDTGEWPELVLDDAAEDDDA